MTIKFVRPLIPIAFVLGAGAVAIAAHAFAADIDAAWLTGRWEATAPSPAGAHLQDKFDLLVKPDGTFEEAILSARGGRLYVTGRWKVPGESAILDGVYSGGPATMNATKKTLTLKRNGEVLEGTRFTSHNNQTLPITFTRAR